jgi:hypothetical protein
MIHGVLQWRAQFTQVAGPPVAVPPPAAAHDVKEISRQRSSSSLGSLPPQTPPKPQPVNSTSAVAQGVHVSISEVEAMMVRRVFYHLTSN